jgi:hypothetical protein
VTTLAIKDTTLFAKVTLQVDPFQESGNSIESRTASGESDFSTSFRWYCNTSLRASSKFAFASARVSPWEIAAGISSTKQV